MKKSICPDCLLLQTRLRAAQIERARAIDKWDAIIAGISGELLIHECVPVPVFIEPLQPVARKPKQRVIVVEGDRVYPAELKDGRLIPQAWEPDTRPRRAIQHQRGDDEGIKLRNGRAPLQPVYNVHE